MAVIEVAGLRKEYRQGRRPPVVALDGLDLSVPAGGVHGFLGPNGSGKTTTIRCLLGLARPTAGTCRVLGADPSRDYARVQGRVGSMIETHALFPGFTGRRNPLLLAEMAGLTGAAVEAALDRVDLAARADDLLATYSLGMRQRLGLAAALMKGPELLILDEPANGLDPAGIRDIRNLLRRLGAEGRTVFVSSHLLAEVQQMCDHVAVLRRGRCVAAGPVDDVLASVGSSGVVVRVDDIAAGLAALAAAGLPAGSDGQLIHVDVPARDSPAVAEALARQGVWPRELRPGGRSLEEAFMALTGEATPP
ncbi:MAG TPA: ABC transporter ATP-binding protein [Acidimicrobiales bacterium]|nr:ABC transporter ATP-binding protein [Acidimicrobiales bacterium]